MSVSPLRDSSIENSPISFRARFGHQTRTLGATLVLLKDDPPLQFLDNGGAARVITLPAEVDSDGLFFYINNTGGGAFAFDVQDDAAGTIATVAQNEGVMLFCNGVLWTSLVGGIT